MLRLYPARTAEELEHARILFLEMGDEEPDELPGAFGPPYGRLLLAEWNGTLAGCVALQPVPHRRACCVERLYVRPGYRRQGIARALVSWAVDEARALGYERACAAGGDGAVYRALGFVGGELALSTRPR
jgi:GNAT superfamily N-acetyltransferase